MTTDVPARKWKVGPYGAEGGKLYSSERKAYEAVAKLTAAGHTVVIRHWEDGRYRIYEKLGPDGLPA